MLKINWDEYKEYKQGRHKKADNFLTLLDFIKSYYHMKNPVDIYDFLRNDDLAIMMLEKREIVDAEGLEKYLFSHIND